MDPQSNQNQGLNSAQPPQGGAVAMPMPPAQTAAGQPFGQQGPPVPAQAPPFPVLPAGQIPGVPPASYAAASPAPSIATGMPGSQQMPPATVANADHELPVEAADADVIERLWVDKAKAIVAATSQDPYRQVRDINQLKAEYMKKRYDKDIKLPDA
jgi:hypothetical protein